jgi:hypothetical protein
MGHVSKSVSILLQSELPVKYHVKKAFTHCCGHDIDGLLPFWVPLAERFDGFQLNPLDHKRGLDGKKLRGREYGYGSVKRSNR